MTNQDNIIADAYLHTAKIAVYNAMEAALRVHHFPWSLPEARTSWYKSSEREHDEDPTHSIDQAATQAIMEVLHAAAWTPGHPLTRGFLTHNEEVGTNHFNGCKGTCDETLLCFVDPVDYTAAAILGLDGSILVSFYDLRLGLLAAVIGDLFQRKMYWRKQGAAAHLMSVTFSQDPSYPFSGAAKLPSQPSGEALSMKSSGKTHLKGSSVNIYMGKPERISLAAKLGAPLWDRQVGIRDIFSVGGSLGPARVGAGLFDASIEIAKGYRPWDLLPGAFIAEGAGAAVVDLAGKPITFGPERIRKEWIDAKFTGDALESCRQKFIVAATIPLAEQIYKLLLSAPSQ